MADKKRARAIPFGVTSGRGGCDSGGAEPTTLAHTRDLGYLGMDIALDGHCTSLRAVSDARAAAPASPARKWLVLWFSS